jgi:formylmethanofuran dehydrogenase subunit C
MLRLEYVGVTTVPVEVPGLSPDRLGGQSLAEIEKLPILHGNRWLPLAEMFRVSGDASDGHVECTGDLAGVHWLGAEMTAGTIHVAGSAGRHVGSQMRGGEIHVEGDAGDWLGAEMRGGLIRARRSAGDAAGGAYAGSPRGMTGGTILIGGDAGRHVGRAMRRGLIAVGGSLGPQAAENMIAGSVLAFGGCGARPAAGMRRGTLALFGESPTLPLTFRRGSLCRPQFLRLYLRRLQSLDFAVAPELLDADYRLYHGDMLCGGRGEVLIRAVQ